MRFTRRRISSRLETLGTVIVMGGRASKKALPQLPLARAFSWMKGELEEEEEEGGV